MKQPRPQDKPNLKHKVFVCVCVCVDTMNRRIW